jgi:hypothetical protein
MVDRIQSISSFHTFIIKNLFLKKPKEQLRVLCRQKKCILTRKKVVTLIQT